MASRRASLVLAPLLAAAAATRPTGPCPPGAGAGTCGGDQGLSLLHLGRGTLGRGRLPAAEAAEELSAPGVAEQPGAAIAVGEELRLYAVGSSNLVYEVWYDMLHAMLRRLGYHLPEQQFRLAKAQRAKRAPRCDDAEDYEGQTAARLGKPGWASWGFAYEDNSDCEGQDHGFRKIEGYFVKCMNGWSCWKTIDNPPEILYKPSAIAQEARDAHVVLLSQWINDSKQWMTSFSCYGATIIDQLDTVAISVASTRRLIRAIHKVNPKAYILVMARYPEQHGVFVKNGTVREIEEINAAMREGLKDEPRTIFADFWLPAGRVMFQSKHQMPGHPNCRGDRVIATSAVEALFQAGVLARGLSLGGAKACLDRDDCAALGIDCCQRSALCRWSAGNGTCVAYGPGEGLVTQGA